MLDFFELKLISFILFAFFSVRNCGQFRLRKGHHINGKVNLFHR